MNKATAALAANIGVTITQDPSTGAYRAQWGDVTAPLANNAAAAVYELVERLSLADAPYDLIEQVEALYDVLCDEL